MVSPLSAARRMFSELLKGRDPVEVMARQQPDRDTVLKPWIRPSKRSSGRFTAAHWRALIGHSDAGEADRDVLYDATAQADLDAYAGNIENYIGVARLPVGVAGPLRVNGIFAKGDYYVPLATSEAALVASYNRGARLVSVAGGASAALVAEGVQRAPAFAFETISEAGAFVAWVLDNLDMLQAAGEATTRHGRLIDVSPHIDGANVYLRLTFSTGDAAGQNMVTIASQALCEALVAACPVRPRYWFVEGNFSGDKKASSLSFVQVRGRKVTASVLLPGALIARYLNTTAERMEAYWRMSAMGGVMSGSIGVQGHYANGLAALFIATGQDAACVAEAAVGVTRMELRDGVDGEGGRDLFVSVTLPNLIVGTVGGGTGLPTQQAALNVMGLNGAGHSRAFAEVAAAVCLAGELSIIGALCAHEFTRAHHDLARLGTRGGDDDAG